MVKPLCPVPNACGVSSMTIILKMKPQKQPPKTKKTPPHAPIFIVILIFVIVTLKNLLQTL